MRTVKSKKAEYFLNFDSVKEYINTALKEAPRPIDNKFLNDGCGKNSEFYGSDSLQESLNMAQGGWPEGGVILRRAATAAATTQTTQTRRRTRLRVAGGAPVVPLALQGVPACMVSREKINITAAPVPVAIIDATVVGTATPETLLRNAAQVLAALPPACELYSIVVGESGRGDFFANLVSLKSLVPNYSQTAFFLCHPSFLRRLVFYQVSRLECWVGTLYLISHPLKVLQKMLEGKKIIPNYYIRLNDIYRNGFKGLESYKVKQDSFGRWYV